MFKTRILGTDAGDRSDFKYYNYSGQSIWTPPNDAMYLEYLGEYITKYNDGMSKAATVLLGTKPIGTQSIESSTRKKPNFNSVRNVKKYGFCFPYLLLSVSSTGSWYCYYTPYWRLALPSVNLNTLPTGEPSWAAAEDAQRRAWWSMQPRFEGEIQLLNSIYELKDFKELVKLMGKTPYGFAESVSNLGRTMRRITKDYNILTGPVSSARQASTIWANLRLANEFALKPLIKDVRAITNQLIVTAEAAQEEFSNRGLESQKSHFTEYLDKVFTGTWGTGNSSMRFVGMYQETKFTATIEYRYKTDLLKNWDLFKRYWGLNVTGSVIWEAIPFSFLADYFLKIGKAIHAMDTDPNVHLDMMQYCESLFCQNANCVGVNPAQSLVRRFYCPSSGNTADYTGFVPVSGVKWTHYQRRVTSPNKGAALPRFSWPTSGQSTNMLALVRGLLH